MGRVNAITFLSFPIRLVDLWKYEDLLSSFLCMQIAAHFNVNKRALKKGGVVHVLLMLDRDMTTEPPFNFLEAWCVPLSMTVQ